MGQDQDDVIFVPITTLQRKMTGRDLAALHRGVGDVAAGELCGAGADHGLLRDRHRIRAGQDDDFQVRNLADIAQLADRIIAR